LANDRNEGMQAAHITQFELRSFSRGWLLALDLRPGQLAAFLSELIIGIDYVLPVLSDSTWSWASAFRPLDSPLNRLAVHNMNHGVTGE
jgi:hypothetical protein